MEKDDQDTLSTQIINRALEYGGSLAGITRIEDLKKSPSHTVYRIMPEFNGVGTINAEGKKQDQIQWPDEARSAVVIAVAHEIEKPELDWWIDGLKGGTKGNAKLISVFSKLADWLETEKQIHCFKLPYHIENGSVFMKDAAVLGGLGCIGKNNMLVSPEFGPRVRLRVMLMNVDLPSTGIADFNPCSDCLVNCKKVCPQKAFKRKIYSQEQFKRPELPGITGDYNRLNCNIQMKKEIKKGKMVAIKKNTSQFEVRHCRRCELICPVGSKAKSAPVNYAD